MKYFYDPDTGMMNEIDEETGEVLATRPFFKTPYNHDTLTEATRTALTCNDKSLTDQSFKDDADINVIMERVMRHGINPDMIALPEHFGSDERVDLYTARSRIAESNKAFYNLPPKIRERFLNDPGRWEQQVLKDLNEGNLDDLKDMGIDPGELIQIDTPAAPQGGSPAPAAPKADPGAPAPGKPPQN